MQIVHVRQVSNVPPSPVRRSCVPLAHTAGSVFTLAAFGTEARMPQKSPSFGDQVAATPFFPVKGTPPRLG